MTQTGIVRLPWQLVAVLTTVGALGSASSTGEAVRMRLTAFYSLCLRSRKPRRPPQTPSGDSEAIQIYRRAIGLLAGWLTAYACHLRLMFAPERHISFPTLIALMPWAVFAMEATLPQNQSGGALHFRHWPDLPTLGSHDDIPRYLLRTYVPSSNGLTHETVVEAPGSGYVHGRVDLLRLPWDKAASMLWGHLKWKNRRDDNLMSWTSSLFFAIQHGLHRHLEDHDHPEYSDIRICIVDTRKFPRGTFAKDLDLMRSMSMTRTSKGSGTSVSAV